MNTENIRFYPITYYFTDINHQLSIIIFSYDDQNKKLAIRVPYNYWFYAILKDKKYSDLEKLFSKSKCSGINLDSEEKIEEKYSTAKHHDRFKSVKVRCDSVFDKIEAIKIMKNNKIEYQELDNKEVNMVNKFLAEYKLKMYGWMEANVYQVNNKFTKFSREYEVNNDTIFMSKNITPPPKFSELSYDIETDNVVNTKRMGKAEEHPNNSINKISITYSDVEKYEEHTLVYGPDISKYYNEYTPYKGTLHTCKTEYEIIKKFCDLINELDPDTIYGHNIFDYDNDYIWKRYRTAALNNYCENINFPNISRLSKHNSSQETREWGNSQIDVKISIITMPGRIWLDTLIAAKAERFGKHKNNKLDTLAENILCMHKNDVSAQDMFKYYSLWRRYNNNENVSEEVNEAYKYCVEKHNKKKIEKKTPSMETINNLISQCNCLDQVGKKIDHYTMKTYNNVKNPQNIYDELYQKYEKWIEKWNIPYLPDLDTFEKIKVLFWAIATYCTQDTRIPYQIIQKQNFIPVLREEASIFRVYMDDILTKGKVFINTSGQYVYAYNMNTILELKKQDNHDSRGYQGAYIHFVGSGLKITKEGDLVIVLDFSSLYPSIMIAYNLCYTTYVPENMRYAYLENGSINTDYIWLKYADLINDEEILNANYEDKGKLMCQIFKIDNDKTGEIYEHWFLRAKIKKGILPTMLSEKYYDRKACKAKMEEAAKNKDMAMYVTYNAQQLAIKVCMNAAYGATGTSTSKLWALPVAETVTFLGRQNIKICHEEITKRNIGTSVYGDTDSAMILIENMVGKCNGDPKKIKEMGDNIASELSKLFPPPMSLECENILVSYFVKCAKNHSGIKWDKTTNFDRKAYTKQYVETFGLMYTKGMSSVRGDKFVLSKKLFSDVLFGILTNTDPDILVRKLEKTIVFIWAQKKRYNYNLMSEYFYYNCNITKTSLSEGGKAVMRDWIKKYHKKYDRIPDAREKFELYVCENNNLGEIYTKNADNLYTLDWMKEDKLSLNVEHYLMALEGKGNVVEILNLAYGDKIIPKDCISRYYLPNLRSFGSIHKE